MTNDEMIDYNNKLKILLKLVQEDNSYQKPEYNIKVYSPDFPLFEKMIKLFELNKLPLVLSDEDYANLNYEELFRGSPEWKYTAELLSSKDYNCGTGYINGIFSTEFKHIASIYSSKDMTNFDINKVMRFKIKSIKGIYAGDLYAILDRLKNNSVQVVDFETSIKLKLICFLLTSINDEELKNKFFVTLENDISKLGILLGMDFIKDSIDGNCYTIILNRNCIAVPQSEYDKFVTNASLVTGNAQNQPN